MAASQRVPLWWLGFKVTLAEVTQKFPRLTSSTSEQRLREPSTLYRLAFQRGTGHTGGPCLETLLPSAQLALCLLYLFKNITEIT